MYGAERLCKYGSMLEFRKTDLLIPLTGIVAALLIFGFYYLSAFGGTGNTAVVYVDGKEFGRFPLSEDTEVIIPGVRGFNNHLVIRDGKADITEAFCPDKICVHERSINKAGETLVCLPNKVVVEIEGERGGIDAVSR